jgi:hypothetical protein
MALAVFSAAERGCCETQHQHTMQSEEAKRSA